MSDPGENSWNELARSKLTRVLGPAEGDQVWFDVMRALGRASLDSAEDLYRFGSELSGRDQFCNAVGSMLCLTAVIRGARVA